jgi:tRNA(adenine34) deaminase
MAMTDEECMRIAFREAEKALENEDVPVGAVIVHEGSLIAKAHNQRELLRDPTAHAEMIAITQAASHIGSWRLDNTTLYVTLEPCAMCAGAMVLARIPRLVFGAFDPKAGAAGSVMDIVRHAKLNHRIEVTSGVMEGECASILKEFFARLRDREE